MIDLWVDDERKPPTGMVWVETSAAAIELLRDPDHTVRNMSLDYVLKRGDYTHKIMEWLRDHPEHWPTGTIECHSSSNDAVRLIEQMIKDFAPAGAD